VWIAALLCGGCARLAAGPAKDAPRQVGATNGGQPISSAELDELTRAFADRYIGLLYSACGDLKKDNPDLLQRREAQVLMTDCAMNVYDIASNPDAFTRMLDLVVVTTLVSQVWIDDDRAAEVFAGRDEVLVRALHHGRVEAWVLAAEVLRPDQLDLLDYLLWDWRRHNPDMVRASFVRFSTFAIGRGRSANAEVLVAGGLFGNVGRAGQAVEEARLLTERMFYLLKRETTLLRWQLETLQDQMLATPEVGRALADVHRLTDQVEQLPKNVAAERQAILSALDDRKEGLDGTLTNVRAALTDANELATSLGQTGDSLNDMLKSSNELLGSSEWDRRIQQVSQSADGRMKMAAEQSQLVVNNFFRRAYVALGALFAMLILCLVTAFLLMRRLRIVAGRARKPSQGSGLEAGHGVPPATNAGGPGRKGMFE
jgi:hypothetical protein